MKSKNTFDWCEYYNLANSFSNSNNDAELRTGISRFYYSSFCKCRDFIKDNKKFLGSESKKIMNSPTPDVHSETINILFNHNDLQPYGAKIGNELSELRRRRNKADYDSSNYNVKSNYIYVKARTEIIFKHLNQLKKSVT